MLDPRDGYEPVWEYLEDLLDYYRDIETEVIIDQNDLHTEEGY